MKIDNSKKDDDINIAEAEQNNTSEYDTKNLVPISIMREIDAMGRIVIPKEIRNVMTVSDVDKIKIQMYTIDDKIILERVNPTCTFCGEENDLIHYNNKSICKACLKHLNSI